MQIALTVKEERFVKAMEAMAGSVGKLSAELNFKLAKSLKEADAVSRQFAQGFGKVGDKMQSFGQNMSMYVTAPLTLMAGATLNAYGELDSLERSLMTVEGTSQNLEKRLVELREAAKLPGLGFQEAIKGDVALRSVGIAATTSLKILKEFGNANAMGGGGKEQLSSIITQLSQMSAKGKVLSEDLKPIITAAPTVAKALKEMFGTVDSGDIQKKLEGAGKNSQDFIEMLLTTLEKAPRVTGGFKNAIENVKDSLFVFSANMGKALDKSFDFERIVNDISAALNSLQIWFTSLSPEIQKAIFVLAGLTATIGPLMIAIGGAIKAYGLLFSGTVALTAGISALALAIAGVVYLMVDYSATKNKIANASKTLAQVEEEVKKSIHGQAEEVRKHTDVLNNNNSTLAQRKTAIEALKNISPQYFGKLDSEKIKYDDLNVSVSKYITNLENAAKANLIQAEIDKKIKTAAEIRLNPSSATSTAQVIGMKLSYVMTGSNPDDLLKYANLMKLNAEVAAGTIEQGIKPLQDKLSKLAELGYKPTVDAKPSTNTTKSSTGKEVTKKLFEGVAVRQIESEYSGDTIEEVTEKLRQRIDNGLRKAFQTAAETDYIKSQNTPFPIEKIISFSERDIMASVNLLNEKFKNLYQKIELFPKPAELNAQSQRFIQDVKDMTERLKIDLVVGTAEGIGEAIGQAISGKGFSLGKFFQHILSTIGQYMIDLGKNAIIAKKMLDGLTIAFGGPSTLPAALAVIAGGGLLKGLAGSLFSQTPKFAEGGMVTGPTFAMMGDNASGREMALPWEKTGVFAQAIAANMGGGGAGVGGNVNFRLRGEDLYGALQQYMKNNGIKSL